MSEAMELIVDSYVKLGSIKALEDMLDHRRKVARQLQFRSISGFDLSMLTTTIGKEIALIEEGIEKNQFDRYRSQQCHLVPFTRRASKLPGRFGPSLQFNRTRRPIR